MPSFQLRHSAATSIVSIASLRTPVYCGKYVFLQGPTAFLREEATTCAQSPGALRGHTGTYSGGPPGHTYTFYTGGIEGQGVKLTIGGQRACAFSIHYLLSDVLCMGLRYHDSGGPVMIRVNLAGEGVGARRARRFSPGERVGGAEEMSIVESDIPLRSNILSLPSARNSA